jgi:hypothetical protein
MDTCKSIDEFLKLNNIDRCKDFKHAFETVVRALDYDMCKRILLKALSSDGMTKEKLKDKFLKGRHLNNIYKHRYMQNYGRVTWK